MQIHQSIAIHHLRTSFMPHSVSNDIAGRFGERVHGLRVSRGLNQIVLSQQCGLSIEHLNQIEAGRMAPTLVVLELLSLGFQMSISELLEGL